MRHFECDYFSFGPFGIGFGPHFGSPRPGFKDFSGACHRRGHGHCGPDREDFGPCGRSHGPPRGPFGAEHGPHRRPHFGADGGEFGPSHGPCGRGDGPPGFGPGHHKRSNIGPDRDSDGEGGPSDFEHCGRRHGPGGPHRRPHFGPEGGDGFGWGPWARRPGPPHEPFGPGHGPHRPSHCRRDRDSDAECGPDFGPRRHRRPFCGPYQFGPWDRRGPCDRFRRPEGWSPPCCRRDNRESHCPKNKSKNPDAEESGTENEGRRCGKQNRSCCSKNKDRNEGDDTVLIQRIIVEKVPRSSSV